MTTPNTAINIDYPDIAFPLPEVVKISDDLFGLVSDCIKRIPAFTIIEQGIAAGLVTPGGHVADTSSGTFALGLAEACRAFDLRGTIVSDPGMDEPLLIRVRELGATVHVVEDPGVYGSFQRARLAKLQEIVDASPGTFVPDQYHRPWHADSYGIVAEKLCDRLGIIDTLVCPVGSGGSSRGLTHCLRIINPKLKVIAVDTHNSVLFGQPDGPRALRGLGNSIHPANVDHTIFDAVHWVSASVAFCATRELHRQYRIFAGATSGAAWLVAQWVARQDPNSTTVAVFPDSGHRYAMTVYNERWLQQQGLLTKTLPAAPRAAVSPTHLDPHWAWFPWQRRTFAQVTGAQW